MTPTPEQVEASARAEEESRKQEGPGSALGDAATGVDTADGVLEVIWSAGDLAITVGRGACDVVVGVCSAVGKALPDL